MMKPILIVEDETVLRESLRDWLTDAGYQVATAGEGEEALKTISEQEFSLAILDLRLPGKDGIEVLKEAKANNPRFRGVIVTAYPSPQTREQAMQEGAVDYLPKPFDLNQLEGLIRDTLGPVQVEIKPKAAASRETGEVSSATVAPSPAPTEAGVKLDQELIKNIQEIIDRNQGSAGIAIRVLQQVQELVGYLPLPVLEVISRGLNIPLIRLYGIVTFYHFFSLVPKGKHVIQVCLGTACYVKGGQKILSALKKEKNLEPEGITPDGKFSLETVRCLGACGLSPVVAIDGEVHGRVKASRLNDILDLYE